MSRYELRALRAAARLTLDHDADMLQLDEALGAIIHLADLLEQTRETVRDAYGSALLEANTGHPAGERARWRALADALARRLAEQREAAEGLASEELIARVRGAGLDHDPAVLARAAQVVGFRPEVSSHEGGYSIWLPELEVYGTGSSLEDARADLVDSVRLYVADWHDHLSDVPDHRQRAHLVALVDQADTDAELSALLFDR